LPQPQLGCSQPQLCSQQQLGSQQLLWQLNKPRRPLSKWHFGRQQGLQQLDSQPQLGSAAQHGSAAQQLGSAAQHGSAAQQLGSQQLDLWHFSMLQRPSSKQQRGAQLGAQQLGSQAQLCSQQQLGSAQPQPPSKPKALALPVLSKRATLNVTTAAKRFMGRDS
jgi:hypothetical protein